MIEARWAWEPEGGWVLSLPTPETTEFHWDLPGTSPRTAPPPSPANTIPTLREASCGCAHQGPI